MEIPDEVIVGYAIKVAEEENRSVSYKDYLHFTFEGKEYIMAHGTFRNKVARLKKDGILKIQYKSRIAFYVPSGYNVGKRMTDNDTGVSNNSHLYQLIHSLCFNKSAIHNIHMKFKCSGLWNVMSCVIANLDKDYSYEVKRISKHNICSLYPFRFNDRSKDIFFEWNIQDYLVKFTIHRTDTITVVIGSSHNPFFIDRLGITDFRCVLSKVEERIGYISKEAMLHHNKFHPDTQLNPRKSIKIPAHEDWIVTMWHLGMDSVCSISGQTFNISIKSLERTVYSIYTKHIEKRKNIIRIERQEYPGKKLRDAIDEKLDRDE